MDYEIARANMIEQQIRPWNVLQVQTLNALNSVRREDFVPEQYKDRAFADVQIPIGDDEVMLEPKLGARMIESLDIKPDHRILEIGTGTGYLTALMASMGAHVTSIEIDQSLSTQAGINLAMAGITNVELVYNDCFAVFQDRKYPSNKFDRVLISGSVVSLDQTFCSLIHESGWVVGIEGNDPAMCVVLGQHDGAKRGLFETSVPRLRNINESPTFTF